MAKIIDPNDVAQGWAIYRDLLNNHKADLEELQQVFNEFYNKAYSTGGWSLTKSLFIDTESLFRDWCNIADEAIYGFPDATTIFWKEYWAFTLIVMTLMFADKMAERARKKTNDPDWGFQFSIYDGYCDLISITVNLINTRTGAHAPYDGANFYPSVKVHFPVYMTLKGFSKQAKATGDFPIVFNPNVNIAKNKAALSIAEFGKELKKAVIAESNGNL